jgi:predicted nuclease of predicted toxin-antitoxin system
LRKINKCSYRCGLCVNKDKQTPILPLSLKEQKEESDRLFEEYDDDFKDTYYSYHLTNEDYKRISKNIISLQNGKYKIEDLEYWAVFKTNNHMLFSSVFYDYANNLVIKANQPILRCDNCNNDWRAKTLEKYKNSHKILCSSCTLCNKTYKIRTTKNCINDIILYQSKLELNFINWCNNNSIIVKNGPVISYIFQDIKRNYKVDFMINDLLIEIKDNHIWSRNDIKSGKNDAKINAVKEAIQNGDYKEYYLITPDIWVNTLKTIKQKQQQQIIK